MTSVEFVIWMRGFMEGSPADFGLSPDIRFKRIVDQLAKVDGVPTPREARTNLRPPKPLLTLPADAADEPDVLDARDGGEK